MIKHTLAVLTAAPYPVLTPQPRRQTLCRGASGSILATAVSWTTVYSEKVLVPPNWNSCFPLHVNLDIDLSGTITPLEHTSKMALKNLIVMKRHTNKNKANYHLSTHWFVFGFLQNLHFLHCRIRRGMTLSPSKSKQQTVLLHFHSQVWI